MKDKTIRSEKSDKRIAILDATLKLISKYGFHNTPMSTVSKKAKVSTGVIYYYFSSKEEIIIELYKKIKIEVIRMMLDGYSEDQAFRERFKSIWLASLKYHMSHPMETSYLEQFENSPYMKLCKAEEIMVELKPIADLITQSTKEGIIKDLPVELLSKLFIAGAVYLSRKHKGDFITLDSKLIEATFNASWDAIKK